jgi:hypothetical protein
MPGRQDNCRREQGGGAAVRRHLRSAVIQNIEDRQPHVGMVISIGLSICDCACEPKRTHQERQRQQDRTSNFFHFLSPYLINRSLTAAPVADFTQVRQSTEWTDMK